MNFYSVSVLLLLFLFPFGAECQVDSGYVEVDKGKIFYTIWGEGDPIVFLNGGPGFSSEGYSEYAKSFSKLGKVILFDQRGTGKSISIKGRNSRQFKMWDLVKDLEALREHLEIDKWSVIGHSFGGQYAMYYLSKHHKVINKMVLSASPECGRLRSFSKRSFKEPPKEELEPIELELHNKITAILDTTKSVSNEVYRLYNAFRSRNYVFDPANIEYVANWFLKNTPDAKYRILGKRYDWRNIKLKLRTVDTPVLIIHGKQDFIVMENPKINHEVLNNSIVELIDDCGHMILLEKPELYLKLIKDFLE